MSDHSVWTKLTAYAVLAATLGTAMLSCGDSGKKETGTETAAATETAAVTETVPLADYGGRAFRVLSSADDYDATNAHALIAGTGKLNGDIVNDTVYERNEEVKDLLNIDLQFVESMYNYNDAYENLLKIVMSGDDLYEVIINDMSTLTPLTLTGIFHNMYNAPNFDLTQKYWYKEVMDDLILADGYQCMLCGDWFMDIIGSCHALFLNKDMLRDLGEDPNMVYDQVMDGKWTIDSFIELTEAAYSDLNGNGKEDEEDRYGVRFVGTYGCVTPFVIASSLSYIDRTQDPPVFTINNEKSVKLLEKLNHIFWEGCGLTQRQCPVDDVAGYLRESFMNKQSLFLAYNRLQDLAKMRDIEFDFAVIPYPKFEETDDYITSLHGTSEVGAVPVTASDLDFITMVIEVLNRETSRILVPEYYESALKVKYTTDTTSAAMIDLIHDSFGCPFPLAYNETCRGILFQCFTDCVGGKKNDFASSYQKKEPGAVKALAAAIETLNSYKDS